MPAYPGGLLRNNWVCKISIPLAKQNIKEKKSACMIKRRRKSKPACKKREAENNNNLDELTTGAGKLFLANGWMTKGCGKFGFGWEIIQTEKLEGFYPSSLRILPQTNSNYWGLEALNTCKGFVRKYHVICRPEGRKKIPKAFKTRSWAFCLVLQTQKG